MNELRLRPLSLGDIFDEGFDLYKRHMSVLLLTAAVVAVPLKAGAAWLTVQFTGAARGLSGLFGGSSFPDITQIWARFGDLSGQIALFFPLYAIGYGLLTAALAAAASACYLGQPVSVWGAYRSVLRRGGPLIATALLWGLGAAVSYLFCLVPAIFFLTMYALTAHTFALEGKTGLGALRRSAALVNGFGGRMWGTLVLLALVGWIVSLGIELPLAYALDTILRSLPGGEAWLGGGSLTGGTGLRRQMVENVSGGLAELFAAPFLLCTLTVFYYDLRVRKEAWDVERLAGGLGYEARPLPPGFAPPTEPPALRLTRPAKAAKKGVA